MTNLLVDKTTLGDYCAKKDTQNSDLSNPYRNQPCYRVDIKLYTRKFVKWVLYFLVYWDLGIIYSGCVYPHQKNA